MLKRVSNKELLSLVKTSGAAYDDGGEAKKVFNPEEAHKQVMRTLEIIAVRLQDTNEKQELIDMQRAVQVSIDNMFSSIMSRLSEVLMETKKEPINYMPMLESIKQKPNEEWTFDASRDSTGKIIFPIKARKI